MDAHALARYLEDHAARLGLEWIGVAPPEVPARDAAAYRRWLEAGHHGEMAYMARPDAVARRERLEETLAGVRSVAVVAEPYPAHDPPGIPDDPSLGVIARYARGRDYHTVLLRKLQAMARGLPEEVTARPYVDTGPLLERALGRMAGLGWQGRNTMLIHPRRGSYFFLGSLLVDAEVGGASEAGGGSSGGLPGGEIRDHCGTCRACLDACPTGALLGRDETGAPVMDARRCISYLTVEHKGVIPPALRPQMGDWVFGCDVCQAVCPWQRFARPTEVTIFQAPPADRARPVLLELLALDEAGFRRRFRETPLLRTGRERLLRNAAVALGNLADPRATPVLRSALADDAPLVRGHAAWALGAIGGDEASEALQTALARETDPSVRQELTTALKGESHR